ncbi:MAG: hypothetical protein ACRDY1_16120, partial [Acidimicrobiales bacterium]
MKLLSGLVICVAVAGVGVGLTSPGVATARAMLSPAASSPRLDGIAGAASSSTGILPPQNPSESLAPSPNFTDDGDCAASALDLSNTCTTDVEKAIDNARSVLESMSGLSLNLSAFEAMTVPEQLFVITNLERTDRGLPAISGLTSQLDSVAQTGASNNGDPDLTASTLTGGASVRSWASVWAGGTSNALGSDYYWMYDDGPGSSNGSCTSPSAPACWGHRDALLGTFASTST